MRIAVVDSHPIQYHVPWFRELSTRCELSVLYAHRQSSTAQARAGYGVAFDWNVDLTSGYAGRFLQNVASDPGTHHFRGCDTPGIGEVIRDGRFDAVIVTGWYLKTFWQTVMACKRAGVPVLVRGDSQLTMQRNRALRAAKRVVYPWLLRSFDGFLSVGTRNRAYLEHFGVPASRIFEVPHLVDTLRFSSAKSPQLRDEARARLGVGEGDRLLLQVGRLVGFKRPMDLLEAVSRLPGTQEKAIAMFAGAGALQAEIEQRARALGVRASMLGFVNQEELPQIYAAADLFVLASESAETWGLVVNEAMAAGVPAVVSDAAGCAPDMIDEGLTGYTFACGDTRALGAALLHALDMRTRDDVIAALARKTQQHSASHAAEATVSAVASLRAGTPSGRARHASTGAVR